MEQELYTVTIWFGALFLWWFFFFAWRDFWVDRTRQDLFEIRDELFSEMQAGNIDKDSQAYGMVRTTLNGMIQFAHEMSFLRLATIYLSYRNLKEGNVAVERYKRTLAEAIDELPEAQQTLVITTIARAHVALVRHIVHISPLYAVFLPLVALVRATRALSGFTRWLTPTGGGQLKPFTVLDTEANLIGHHWTVRA